MPFQRYITRPPEFQNRVGKRQICSRLVTADQGGQKNRNGKNNCDFLSHIFQLVL